MVRTNTTVIGALAVVRGQASVRQVQPHGLVHTGHHWYLVAWDPARDDWRTFRIDRVQVYISDQHAVDNFFNTVYQLRPIPDRLAA